MHLISVTFSVVVMNEQQPPIVIGDLINVFQTLHKRLDNIENILGNITKDPYQKLPSSQMSIKPLNNIENDIDVLSNQLYPVSSHLTKQDKNELVLMYQLYMDAIPNCPNWDFIKDQDPFIYMDNLFNFLDPFVSKLLDLIHFLVQQYQPLHENENYSLFITPHFAFCTIINSSNYVTNCHVPNFFFTRHANDFPKHFFTFLALNSFFSTYLFQRFSPYNVSHRIWYKDGIEFDDFDEIPLFTENEFAANPSLFTHARVDFNYPSLCGYLSDNDK